jgi:hypothetical protein
MAKTAAAETTKKPANRKSALYDVHPSVAMMQKWIGELKE